MGKPYTENQTYVYKMVYAISLHYGTNSIIYRREYFFFFLEGVNTCEKLLYNILHKQFLQRIVLFKKKKRTLKSIDKNDDRCINLS